MGFLRKHNVQTLYYTLPSENSDDLFFDQNWEGFDRISLNRTNRLHFSNIKCKTDTEFTEMLKNMNIEEKPYYGDPKELMKKGSMVYSDVAPQNGFLCSREARNCTTFFLDEEPNLKDRIESIRNNLPKDTLKTWLNDNKKRCKILALLQHDRYFFNSYCPFFMEQSNKYLFKNID